MADLGKSFDNRDGYIWLNGKFVDWSDANTHILSHGLHYASSVFEGERAYGGKVFKLEEHHERFHRSAEILDFVIPYTVTELNDAVSELLERQKIVNGYIRPIAWRGSEQMAILGNKSTIHVAIATWSPDHYRDVYRKKEPISMLVADWRRPPPNTAPCFSKTAAVYSICTISKHKACSLGFDDALMLDWRGYVAEGSGANLFMVCDGELHTPKPDCFLNGITRQTSISLAQKMGIKVHERHIKPEELADAQEVFITGTAAEIMPVAKVSYGDINYSFTEDRVYNLINQGYLELVNS